MKKKLFIYHFTFFPIIFLCICLSFSSLAAELSPQVDTTVVTETYTTEEITNIADLSSTKDSPESLECSESDITHLSTESLETTTETFAYDESKPASIVPMSPEECYMEIGIFMDKRWDKIHYFGRVEKMNVAVHRLTFDIIYDTTSMKHHSGTTAGESGFHGGGAEIHGHGRIEFEIYGESQLVTENLYRGDFLLANNGSTEMIAWMKMANCVAYTTNANGEEISFNPKTFGTIYIEIKPGSYELYYTPSDDEAIPPQELETSAAPTTTIAPTVITTTIASTMAPTQAPTIPATSTEATEECAPMSTETEPTEPTEEIPVTSVEETLTEHITEYSTTEADEIPNHSTAAETDETLTQSTTRETHDETLIISSDADFTTSSDSPNTFLSGPWPPILIIILFLSSAFAAYFIGRKRNL